MNQEEVLRLFEESEAQLNGHFKLTSGRHSDVYYEKFNLLKNPALCTLLCKEMANNFVNDNIETVVGPTTGGIILAYDIARYLGVQSIYAEAGKEGRVFNRGFSLKPGERVIIVDDILTTGRSIFEVIDLVKKYDAEIVGIALMLDRAGGTVDFGYPCKSLASISAVSWDEDSCPLCKDNQPFTQRGSRVFSKK